jgi:hypothetical protein
MPAAVVTHAEGRLPDGIASKVETGKDETKLETPARGM